MDLKERLRMPRSYAYNLLYIMYLIFLMFPGPNENLFMSVISIVALFLSLPGIGRVYQFIIFVVVVLSLVLMSVNHLFTYDVINYFSGTTNILVLISYAPLFSIPVYFGLYPRKISRFIKGKIHSFTSLYATFSLTTYIFCTVMSAPAIPTVQASLSRLLKKLPTQVIKEFQSATFVRAFITTIFWAPVATAPTIAISRTGANALIVLPITFSLGFLILCVDIFTSHMRFRHKYGKNTNLLIDDEIKGSNQRVSKRTKRSLYQFFCLILVFICTIFSVNHWFGFSILNTVILLIIPYSFLWSLLLKRGKRYGTKLKSHFSKNVPKLAPQVALFISISLFINVIDHSKVTQYINGLVLSTEGFLGPFVLMLIGLIVFIMTWAGIIPQLAVVLVVETIHAGQTGLTPEWFAIAVLSGALSGSASSPFAVNANIVAVAIQDDPMNVIKRNQVFAFIVFIITALLAVLLQYLF